MAGNFSKAVAIAGIASLVACGADSTSENISPNTTSNASSQNVNSSRPIPQLETLAGVPGQPYEVSSSSFGSSSHYISFILNGKDGSETLCTYDPERRHDVDFATWIMAALEDARTHGHNLSLTGRYQDDLDKPDTKIFYFSRFTHPHLGEFK